MSVIRLHGVVAKKAWYRTAQERELLGRDALKLGDFHLKKRKKTELRLITLLANLEFGDDDVKTHRGTSRLEYFRHLQKINPKILRMAKSKENLRVEFVLGHRVRYFELGKAVGYSAIIPLTRTGYEQYLANKVAAFNLDHTHIVNESDFSTCSSYVFVEGMFHIGFHPPADFENQIERIGVQDSRMIFNTFFRHLARFISQPRFVSSETELISEPPNCLPTIIFSDNGTVAASLEKRGFHPPAGYPERGAAGYRRYMLSIGDYNRPNIALTTKQAIRKLVRCFLEATRQTPSSITGLLSSERKTTRAEVSIDHTTPIEVRREQSIKTMSSMKSSQSEYNLTWVHLSDIHYCESRTGWDAYRVLKPLLKDFKKMENEHGLMPQFLFFSGDAAFGNVGNDPGSTLDDQFDAAHGLLAEICNSFRTPIEKENVFIVPGNHDVDRTVVTPDQTDWLAKQKSRNEINELIHRETRMWERYMERLRAYNDFLRRHQYDHLLLDPKRAIYGLRRQIHGLKIGIAGFNSAWACGANGEKGRLWFGGDWQSGHLLKTIGDVDFSLALVHHPFGWFVEQEDSPVRAIFERDFAFHLHGHEHLGWVDHKANGHVRVAAAACYDSSERENGYSYVRLNLKTGEGEVWLRRYDVHGGGWIPRAISGKANNDGLWRLGKLPWLQSLLSKVS